MRPSTTDLMRQLHESCWRYDFFQLARLILLYPGRPKSTAVDPVPEVYFRGSTSMAFPLGEVESLNDDRQRNTIEVISPVMGLFGPAGTLPHCDLAAIVGQNPDTLLIDFLDFFHNRLYRLLYQTWKKNRPDVSLEAEWVKWVGPHAVNRPTTRFHEQSLYGLRMPTTKDPFTQVQMAWAGFPRLEAEHKVPEDLSLLPVGLYSSLNAYFARPVRSGAAIEGILSVCLKVPVRVEPFSPRKMQQPLELRTRLGTEDGEGAFNRLGAEASLSSSIVDYQSRFEVEVGPLSAEEFAEFCPFEARENRYQLFLEVCRALVGSGMEWGLRLAIQPEAIRFPTCLDGVRLGYNSWVVSSPTNVVRKDPYFDCRWEFKT